jgi:outer membrane protein TolC
VRNGTWALLFVGLLFPALSAVAETVTVAVVRDGPGPEDALVTLIEEELTNHTPRGTTVEFKQEPSFDAGWSYDNAAAALQAAFDDPQVDYVLTVGSLVTNVAGRPDVELTKPVVSAFVQRSDAFALPYSTDGESLKKNLSFIVIPRRAGVDIETFRELIPFRALHVAVTMEDLNNFKELAVGLRHYEQAHNIEISLVPVTTEIEDAMGKLDGASAVYLTRLQRLTLDQRRRLIGELNQREIPTFSMLGHPDVELGVLAGETPDIERQVVRRVALNLGRLMRGKTTGDLPVLLSVDSRLKINGRTAKEIGYSPGRETLVFAEILHPEVLEGESRALEFAELFATAESGNKALQVADSEVEGVRQDQDRAKSGLLPQILADLTYSRADTDLTDSDDGLFGSLVLRQQIYDDAVWSSYKSSQKIYQGAELAREVDRLDVLAAAGQAFYGLALAQSQYRIVAGDVRLTHDNLELARLRRDVGYSGREEVLRWESVLAERRTSLFRAIEGVETALIALNQVLGTDQNSRWSPAEPAIGAEVFPVFGGVLDPVMKDLSALQRAYDALVEVALENAPELQALDKSIDAQDIQVDQLKRSFVLPRFFADAAYSEQLTAPDGLIFPEDETYSVSVTAAYPVFQGGKRRSDLGRARSDLDTLGRQRRLIEERIEQRARTAMQRCANSFPRIRFGRQAAAAATENLELVREQYAQGIVNVTDLLDAQNQKLTADQFANSAVYEFMGDLVELQRALAWFEDDHTAEEREALTTRILSAVGMP